MYIKSNSHQLNLWKCLLSIPGKSIDGLRTLAALWTVRVSCFIFFMLFRCRSRSLAALFFLCFTSAYILTHQKIRSRPAEFIPEVAGMMTSPASGLIAWSGCYCVSILPLPQWEYHRNWVSWQKIALIESLQPQNQWNIQIRNQNLNVQPRIVSVTPRSGLLTIHLIQSRHPSCDAACTQFMWRLPVM